MRQLNDWIASFEQYTNLLSAPAIYRRWAGISVIAAALERKVWIETAVGVLYPNLYIFLVGPPGVSKTVMTSLLWRMMKELKDHKIASSSITRATLIEELAEATRFRTVPGMGAYAYNSLYVISNELGVLLPGYELEFMSKLTDLYDCHPYSERRRNAKHNADIKRPQLNIFAGTQPGYLSSIIPEIAWEQGFLSRSILVYSGDIIRNSLWSRNESDAALWEKIMIDLKLIGSMWGEFRFTPGAAELIDAFYRETHKVTAPLHPKLQHYNTRRPAHLLKLMQVASAATRDDFVINEEHFQRAHDWLVEVEGAMPEIFKAMNTGGDNSIMKDAWYYIYQEQIKSGKAIPEDRLIAYLGQRVPAEKIRWIIDVMQQAKLLTVEIGSYGNSFRANGTPS